MHPTFLLLGLAMCAVWLPPVRLGGRCTVPSWVPVFAASVAVGVVSGVLAWPAVLALGVFALTAWGALHAPAAWGRHVLLASCGTMALALALHRVPGFNNPLLYEAVRFSAEGPAQSRYLNFDKGVAGLVLLAAFCARVRRLDEARGMARVSLWFMAGTSALVMGCAWVGGYVRWDPKLQALAFVSVVANLFFVCVAEEAFFRGLLQERLARAIAARSGWRWLPIGVSTVLFALAHAGGGAVLVALAALAGLGYSLAYALTRRIEAAILTHFAVNAVHFLFFSYPLLPG